MLTVNQLRFFRTFGYLHLPGLMRDRIEHITASVEDLMLANGGGAYAGEHRLVVSPAINHHDALCRAILDDDLIDGVAASLLGIDYQYWNSEASYYAGDTPWHADSPWPSAVRYTGWCKLMLYLDPLTRDTGALRVIPGSHRGDDGYANAVHYGVTNADDTGFVDPVETWSVEARDVPAVALSSVPGDVIVIDYLTAHASFGGVARRRLLSAEFCPLLEGDDADQLRRAIRNRRYTQARVFGADGPLLGNAPERRLPHLQQLRALTPAQSSERPSPLARLLNRRS